MQQANHNDSSLCTDSVPGKASVLSNTQNVMSGSIGKDREESVNCKNNTSPSSESGSPSTERQLFLMLHKNRVQEIKKERNSSSRSVTSIEMDGDNLVVVTEEIDEDSIFEDEDEIDGSNSISVSRSYKDSGVGTLTSRDTDYTSTSSSEYPSPTSEHYHKILGELQQTVEEDYKPSAGSISEPSRGPTPSRADVCKLKESLSLQLDLTATAPDITITPEAPRSHDSPCSISTCSSSTSGPDSRVPSPITPPDSPMESPRSARLESPGYATSESGNDGHMNLTFPENSLSFGRRGSSGGMKKTAKEQLCGVFSVDLGG